MAKRKQRIFPLVIGGVIGLTIHFFLGHAGDFADYYTLGLHNINGIAFTLAGTFIAFLIGRVIK